MGPGLQYRVMESLWCLRAVLLQATVVERLTVVVCM
jgi:hypothetical protein